MFSKKQKSTTSYIPWNSLNEDEIKCYEQTMENNLNSISIPRTVLHGSSTCNVSQHCHVLESYFHDICNAIVKADLTLPRKKHGVARHFWSDELTDLKQKSIDSCELWKLAGCPRSGPIFCEKQKSHYNYKIAVRRAKKDANKEVNNDLNDALASHDYNTFWKRFNSTNANSENVCRIDGFVDEQQISNSFKNTFSNVYNAPKTEAHVNLDKRFCDAHNQYTKLHGNDDLGQFYFSWNDMIMSLSKLKLGKATGGFVRSQHVFLGSPKLAIHLNILFNGLVQHNYVPCEFLNGTVTPVVKDRDGDINDSSNYRPVTLSNIFSQLLENLLILKMDSFLQTDNLQFGFKRKHSCSHALYVLRSTVDYFSKHGSSTIVTFLDCSKAFDKISHRGLFLKLIERNVPLCYVNLLIYWYSNMENRCKWQSAFSNSYSVPSGVKQGGVISPKLFTVYIDDLVKLLRKKGIGCYIDHIFTGSLLFADDLCLIAPSRKAMQKMLDICVDYCAEYCLSFNPKKSKSMFFGKNHNNPPCCTTLNGEPIQFVKEWRYLGAIIVSGKNLSFSPRNDLRNFYSSFNSIFNSFTYGSETVLMHLLYTCCVPSLSYASDVKEFSSSEMSKCNSALNNAIRKIFTFNHWESIRTFRTGLGYNDLFTIFAKRRLSSQTGLCNSHN